MSDLTGFLYPITDDRDRHWLYCRLCLSNGEVAWSSPILVPTE